MFDIGHELFLTVVVMMTHCYELMTLNFKWPVLLGFKKILTS